MSYHAHIKCMLPLCNWHPLSALHVLIILLIRFAFLLVSAIMCSSLGALSCYDESPQMPSGGTWFREARLSSDASSDAESPGPSWLDRPQEKCRDVPTQHRKKKQTLKRHQDFLADQRELEELYTLSIFLQLFWKTAQSSDHWLVGKLTWNWKKKSLTCYKIMSWF